MPGGAWSLPPEPRGHACYRFGHAARSSVPPLSRRVRLFTDEQRRPLDASPPIDPAQIAHTESMFFHEQPPNDGHRKNILKSWHLRVAIGVAQTRRTPTEIPVPCIAQEFLDDYGTYAAL